MEAEQAMLSEPAKAALKEVGDKWAIFEEMAALLCKAQATISSERDYVAEIASTNVPLEPVAAGSF